jgi:hypothetical protein
MVGGEGHDIQGQVFLLDHGQDLGQMPPAHRPPAHGLADGDDRARQVPGPGLQPSGHRRLPQGVGPAGAAHLPLKRSIPFLSKFPHSPSTLLRAKSPSTHRFSWEFMG